MILSKKLALLFFALAILVIAHANEPVLNGSAVQELFTMVEGYCQNKMMNGNKTEKDFFSFYLNDMRTKNAVHVAANYEEGKVWFIEPMTGIHIMIVPKSYMVEDKDFCAELETLFGGMTEIFFTKKYDSYRPVAAELKVDLASWTDPTAPRNQINIDFQLKINKKGSNDFELANYNGKAMLNFGRKSGRENVSDKIKKLEAELDDLYAQLAEVEKSDSYSKQMAIMRLKREIEDVENSLKTLKKSL